MEGWGIRSFKFTPGSASPAPLTLRVTSDVSNFDGVLVYKSTADGLWSTQDLDFNNNVATGLIQGFGNLTDEVYAHSVLPDGYRVGAPRIWSVGMSFDF